MAITVARPLSFGKCRLGYSFRLVASANLRGDSFDCTILSHGYRLSYCTQLQLERGHTWYREAGVEGTIDYEPRQHLVI